MDDARSILGPTPPRLSLARLPTPLEPSPRLGAELGIELWWKRDDMTGMELTGNKSRKLELLVAEARAQGADTLVTFGALQSNHCRATAFAAAKAGLHSYLVLRTAEASSPPPLDANSLLDTLAGAELRLVGVDEYNDRARLVAAVETELRARGRRPYIIPEGGSNGLGAWGYILAMAELHDQVPPAWHDEPLAIAYAVGSGGTAAGVELGLRMLGWKSARPLGFAVWQDRATFQRIVAGIAAEAHGRWQHVPELRADDISIDDGFVGPGYGQSTPEMLALLRRIARVDGVVLDPVYTLKAFAGAIARLAEQPSLPRRLVFLHTGGIFGVFPFAAQLR